MNTTQAAEALGMTPRALRRHLRLNPSLTGRGEGRKYVFDDESLEAIRATLKPAKPVDPPELEWLDQTPGIPLHALRDPRMKRRALEQRRERAARLDARLAQLAREAADELV